MSKPKRRTIFWVVSTHVLTSGFAMPTAAEVCAVVLSKGMHLTVGPSLLLLLSLLALGYVGGTFYSFSYLRKVALIGHPTACVGPSIVTFVILAAIGFVANTAAMYLRPVHGINPVVAMAALAIYYFVICLIFAKITRQGFSRFASESENRTTVNESG